MPRSTKGRAAARGLDARLILQHASCLLEMLHSKQLRSIKMLLDSNHGIYREPGANQQRVKLMSALRRSQTEVVSR
jgi:hypothetical protein